MGHRKIKYFKKKNKKKIKKKKNNKIKIKTENIQQEKSKSTQLLKEVGEYAGLDDEDRKSLEELLTTEINDN